MSRLPATSRSPAHPKLLCALTLCALTCLLSGCATPGAEVASMATGRVLDAPQMSREFDALIPPGTTVEAPLQFSVGHYAQVDSRWINGFMARVRSELSQQGVAVCQATGSSGWDERFNCTEFADFFVGHADVELMVSLWNSALPADRPAMLVVWYLPDRLRSSARAASFGRPQGHAVVLIYTESGPKWWDPQTGEIHLTARELGSIYQRRA